MSTEKLRPPAVYGGLSFGGGRGRASLGEWSAGCEPGKKGRRSGEKESLKRRNGTSDGRTKNGDQGKCGEGA